MTFARTTLTALVVSMVMAVSGQSADAASYRHIDTLALRLQEQSRKLYNEFNIHFRHASEFAHLRSDSASIYHVAKHIHELARHGGNVANLEADLRKADRHFHHLEEVVRGISYRAGYSSGRHIDSDTRPVRSLMRAMEETLHLLRDDIEELAFPSHGGRLDIGHGTVRHVPHVGVGHGVIVGRPTIGHGWGHGGGVYFGSRGVTVRIGH